MPSFEPDGIERVNNYGSYPYSGIPCSDVLRTGMSLVSGP